MNQSRGSAILKLLISLVVPQLAGLIGSIFTAPAIPTWYAGLEKPSFTPPSWLFAPAWITLFLLMGIAAFLVWQRGLGKHEVRAALAIFLIQLAANALWSLVFFGLRTPLGGMIIIAVLWVAILVNLLAFFRNSRAAGLLLLPYILWVTFAAVLNGSILLLNP